MIEQVCSSLISSLLPSRGCVDKCSRITASDFLSRATFMYEQFPELMNMLWTRMLKDNKKNWRRVYKVFEGVPVCMMYVRICGVYITRHNYLQQITQS